MCKRDRDGQCNAWTIPDFFDVDLPRIEAEMGDGARFEEFLACLDKAILEITRNSHAEGSPLVRPPLSAYRKKKFHSVRKPPKGVSTDFRLVFRYESETEGRPKDKWSLHDCGILHKIYLTRWKCQVNFISDVFYSKN